MIRHILAGALLATAIVQTPAAADEDPSRLASRRGFIVSTDVIGSRLVLPSRTTGELAAAGVATESRGLGLEVRLGYAFSPRFALGVRLSGSRHIDSVPEEEVQLAQAVVEVTVRLRPDAVLDPFIFAGLGGASIGFGETVTEDTEIEAGVMSTGVGADVRLSRHVGFTARYRYDVIDIEAQDVYVAGSGLGAISVGGDAEAHTLSYGVTVRF